MSDPAPASAAKQALRFLAMVRRPEFQVFLPAITLAGYWLGGEQVLLLLALGLPLLFALTGSEAAGAAGGALDDGPSLDRALSAMDRTLATMGESGRLTACLVVLVDDIETIRARLGRMAEADVHSRTLDRLRGVLRLGDHVVPLQGEAAVVVLAPVRRLDLEVMIDLCARLQRAVSAPLSIDGAQIHVTCSVGFCIGGRSAEPTGRSLLEAAQLAAEEAAAHGPGALRAYTPDMHRHRASRDALRDSLEGALDRGEIRPWFQPQVSTDTGGLTGMEALARWHHPDRGCLVPAEFLPAVEGSDLSERLSEVMLYQSLAALSGWDKAGLPVPSVSVNFSAAELRNPRLPERVKWELDRFDLTPSRLTVEILETVVARSDNDVIVANIAALAAMGCGIDLDDFGTGNASITTLRRFAVRRLKIDRSFVTRVDEDREQQRMVAAILSMSERLGLQTLAEGVETAGEHAMLAQLGCGHVQGFAVARPMALEQATDWIARHRARKDRLPRIGAKGG